MFFNLATSIQTYVYLYLHICVLRVCINVYIYVYVILFSLHMQKYICVYSINIYDIHCMLVLLW